MSDWIEHLTDNIKAAEGAKQRRRDWLALRSEILKSKADPAWKNVVAACEKDVHKINQKLTEKFPGDQSKLLTFECSRSRHFGWFCWLDDCRPILRHSIGGPPKTCWVQSEGSAEVPR